MRAIDFGASVVAWSRDIDGLLFCLLGGFSCVCANNLCASMVAWPRGIDGLLLCLFGGFSCVQLILVQAW